VADVPRGPTDADFAVSAYDTVVATLPTFSAKLALRANELVEGIPKG
jgi:hypothetical protein